jgi:ParB family chromosome partitioning protein
MKKNQFNNTLAEKLNKLNNSAQGVFSNVPKIVEIELDKIVENPNQPRLNYDKEKLEELKQSIKENGLLSPILLKKKKEKYEIIAGHRRFLAYKQLNKETIPAIIKDISNETSHKLVLTENLIRDNLDPLEIALSLEKMLEKNIASNQAELANILGLSPSKISRYLKLTQLPSEIKEKVHKKEYTNLVVLNALLSLDIPIMLKIFNEILEKKLNREESLKLIKQNKNKKDIQIIKGKGFKLEKKEHKTKIEIDSKKLDNPEIHKLVTQLENLLNCTVQ